MATWYIVSIVLFILTHPVTFYVVGMMYVLFILCHLLGRSTHGHKSCIDPDYLDPNLVNLMCSVHDMHVRHCMTFRAYRWLLARPHLLYSHNTCASGATGSFQPWIRIAGNRFGVPCGSPHYHVIVIVLCATLAIL